MKYHLDGARIFNALTETTQTTADFGKLFDTISVCLSKGLGAPIGSLLISNTETIKKAKRVRKLFGGAMRQAGYIAAAGLYALKNNVVRLKEDHLRAKKIEQILLQLPFVEKVLPVDTNIIIFHLKGVDSKLFLETLRKNNIWALSINSSTIRFVTHLDFTSQMLNDFESIVRKLTFD